MKPSRRWLRADVLLLGVALLVRGGVVFYVRSYAHPEEYEFSLIARNWLAGRGYSLTWGVIGPQDPLYREGSWSFGPLVLYPERVYPDYPLRRLTLPTALMAPGVVFAMVPFLALFPDRPYLFYQLFVGALTALIPLFLLDIGRRMGYGRAGWLAGWAAALYPELAYSVTTLTDAPWTALGWTVLLWCAVRWVQRPECSRAVGLGLAMGGFALFNPSTMAYFPLILLLGIGRNREKRVLIGSLVALVISLAVLSPWLVRNACVLGAPVLRTAWGLNLLRGNHPGATGMAYYPPDRREITTYSLEQRRGWTRLPLQEREIDRRLAQEAWSFIRHHPDQYLTLSLRRLLAFWTVVPHHPLSREPAYWLPHAVLIPGLVAGYVVLGATSAGWILLGAPIYTTLLYSATIVLPRYRTGIVPVLLFIASVGYQALLRRLLLKRGGRDL